MLTNGLRTWISAVDDCHNVNSASNFNGGWIVVFADELTQSAILASMRAGNFYASTGAVLSISVSGLTIIVVTDSESTIEFLGKYGLALSSVENSLMHSYTVKGSEQFARVRITRNSDSKKAWSNPFYVNNNNPLYSCEALYE
jgi:hypothetical protein